MWTSSNTSLLARTETNWFLLLLLSQVLNEITNGFQITGWSIFNLHLSSLPASSDIVDHSLHLEILSLPGFWHTTLFVVFALSILLFQLDLITWYHQWSQYLRSCKITKKLMNIWYLDSFSKFFVSMKGWRSTHQKRNRNLIKSGFTFKGHLNRKLLK